MRWRAYHCEVVLKVKEVVVGRGRLDGPRDVAKELKGKEVGRARELGE